MKKTILILTIVLMQSIIVIQPVKAQNIEALENYLVNLYDPEVGLVRESNDPTIIPGYWLLSDNLLAMYALKRNHPEISQRINQTMQKYNRWNDGVHESIVGETIPMPPTIPAIANIESLASGQVRTEERPRTYGHEYMLDWIDYADLLLYASLSYHNAGQEEMAKHYFRLAADMWNDAGLYDKPTREDGYFTTYKLGLLLYVSLLLDEPLPFKVRLEEIIWSMQREDGGLRSHYKAGEESDREANSETASIVLLAYQLQEELEREKAEAEERERQEREAQERQRWIMMVLVIIAVVAVIIISVIVIVTRR